MGVYGQVVTVLGFLACCSTVVLGVIYLSIQWPEDLTLRWSDCSWFPESWGYKDIKTWSDCNTSANYKQGQTAWSQFFSVIGILPAEPLIFGIFGSFMHRPCLLQVFGFPRNFLQYSIFLIVMALFANFSYCGKWGVILGFYSLLVGLLAIGAQITGEKSDRMIRLSGSRRLRDHCDCEEDQLWTSDSDFEK